MSVDAPKALHLPPEPVSAGHRRHGNVEHQQQDFSASCYQGAENIGRVWLKLRSGDRKSGLSQCWHATHMQLGFYVPEPMRRRLVILFLRMNRCRIVNIV